MILERKKKGSISSAITFPFSIAESRVEQTLHLVVFVASLDHRVLHIVDRARRPSLAIAHVYARLLGVVPSPLKPLTLDTASWTAIFGMEGDVIHFICS